jgi:cell division protein FtsB
MSEIQELWSLVIVFGILFTVASVAVMALIGAVFYLNDVIRDLRFELEVAQDECDSLTRQVDTLEDTLKEADR